MFCESLTYLNQYLQQHKVQQRNSVNELLNIEATKWIKSNHDSFTNKINTILKQRMELMNKEFDNCVKNEVQCYLKNEIDERVQDLIEQNILKHQHPLFTKHIQEEIETRINNQVNRKMIDYENQYNRRIQEQVQLLFMEKESEYKTYIENQVKDHYNKITTTS